MDTMGTGDGYTGDCVTFVLNGAIQKVSSLPPSTSLLTYIREHAQLKGTRFMCREGGCGACIVNISYANPASKVERCVSVNSCLYPLYSCHGRSVTTVEGIGSKQKGYHPVQQRLADFYGTQCGYCSPGWVMSMYSLLMSKPFLTMKEIEESLGSNICRCTGYRPILDAFKTFAEDCSPELKEKVTDIEDLSQWYSGGSPCHGSKHLQCDSRNDHRDCLRFVEVALSPVALKMAFTDGSVWYRVTSVQEIFQIFDMVTDTYMLVGGNTAQGVFEFKYPTPPQVYIDISGVSELHGYRIDAGYLLLGGNMTLTDTLELFKRLGKDRPETFSYLCVLAKHLEKVAHIPVRNVGTLGGSLTAKHIKKRFESDVFTIFETVGAILTIVSGCGVTQLVTLTEFLSMDMYKKVITQITFQPLDKKYYCLKTYKIAKIMQNSHAYVNAGFLFKLDENSNVLERPRIVYGGIAPNFVHADATEHYLTGKRLLDNTTLQGGLSSLDLEVQPDRELPQASKEYRKSLALSLFYRYMLSINPDLVRAKYRSGGQDLHRPLSSGKQEFSTDPSLYPVNKPLPKLESLIQCAGEAEYTYDIPVTDTELFAALVLTDQGPSVLLSVDAEKALAIEGVVAFFTAKDIPGKNTTGGFIPGFYMEDELLFAEGVSECAGQAVGVIVACRQEIADFAASRVVIQYAAQSKPLLTAQEVLASGRPERIAPRPPILPVTTKPDVTHVVKGTLSTQGQYHYTMETHTCRVLPTAEGLEVDVATQWTQSVQEALALVLGLPNNRIDVRVRRLGGAFGAKIIHANPIACACALAAYSLQRPVRIILPMETNMRTVGPRKPTLYEYEVGVNDEGVIQKLSGNFYDNVGLAANEDEWPLSILGLRGLFNPDTWNIQLFDVHTDRATTLAMRSPGTFPAYISMNHMMEHIAKELQMDALQVRLNNLNPTSSGVLDTVKELKEKADYDKRVAAVHRFNSENMWKKRGICLLPMEYTIVFLGPFSALISIYQKDGTVAIQHGGVEMGQGINTKAAQVCAQKLGIPLHYIQVKETFNLTSPNNFTTGGSITGDGVNFAVSRCCEILNERLAPIRARLENSTWVELIQEAFRSNIDLNVTAVFNSIVDGRVYTLLGAGITEVEIDCLTGQHTVVRCDLMEDPGQSVNPYVDIGQVEGAYVMGLGMLTSEELLYDETTGLLKTDRSWDYKVPQAQDIPVDFRVYLKKNSDNPIGPTRAKGISEPPILLSWSVFLALRKAIESARIDLGYPDDFFKFEPPATAENIFLRCGNTYKDYSI